MHAWLRLVLILIFAGAAATALATLAARWLSEERRLARAFAKGLGGRPDAFLIAHGAGRGMAISLAAQRMVTVWDAGGWRMDYPLAELIGAELDLDGDVAARVLKAEPRRLLDRKGGAEREVRLRLLFDQPRHPDFDLVLWPSTAPRAGFDSPREAIAEANRWLARLEAILRRSGPTPAPTAVARPAPPSPKPAKVATPPPEDDTADLFGDDPPFDVDDDEGRTHRMT